MTTLRFTLGMLAITLAACGGNYSNDDVLFRNAVPSKEALSSKLTASSQALRSAQSASLLTGPGPSTAVAVGDASGMAAFTLGASQGFNQGLDTILDVLQAVVSLEPSERHPNERIWGPFPDQQHPNFEVELVMTHSGDEFDYHVDARHQHTSEVWNPIVKGKFLSSGGLRGIGELHYLAIEARALGYDLNASDAAAIDVTYQTQTEPVTVDLVVPSVTQPVPLLDFDFAGNPDGSGQMRFDVTGQLAGGSTSQQDTLEIVSKWKPDGSGRSDAQITAGDYVGASYVECWSTADTILYSDPSWSTAVGTEASCPVF